LESCLKSIRNIGSILYIIQVRYYEEGKKAYLNKATCSKPLK
jgi:hypothetical protein